MQFHPTPPLFHQPSNFINEDFTPYPLSPDLLDFARSIGSMLPISPSDLQFKRVLLGLFHAKADPRPVLQLIEAYLPVAAANNFEYVHFELEKLKMELTDIQDPASSSVYHERVIVDLGPDESLFQDGEDPLGTVSTSSAIIIDGDVSEMETRDCQVLEVGVSSVNLGIYVLICSNTTVNRRKR